MSSRTFTILVIGSMVVGIAFLQEDLGLKGAIFIVLVATAVSLLQMRYLGLLGEDDGDDGPDDDDGDDPEDPDDDPLPVGVRPRCRYRDLRITHPNLN